MKTTIVAEPGTPFVTMTREFNAPRDLVFRAHIDPELFVQWIGPRRLTTRVEQWEARHGGSWRFVQTDTDGSEYGFRGVFHGDPSVDGVTQTWEFDVAAGHISLDCMTFEELDGKTILRSRTVYQSVDDRDATLEAGMADGADESMERLDELLARLVPVH